MGVQGNRYDAGYAQKGLLDFDYSDFSKVKEWSGLTMEEIKEAIRLATDDTAVWANKESAADLSKHLRVPYRAMRKRVKVKRRMMTFSGSLATARIWYGINPLDAKYLAPKQLEGGVQTQGKGIIMKGFISPELKGHVFKRTGASRLPIEKQTLDVEDKAASFLETTFEPKVAEYYLDAFYARIDQMMGNDRGTASAKFSGTLRPQAIFERK